MVWVTIWLGFGLCRDCLGLYLLFGRVGVESRRGAEPGLPLESTVGI